MSALLPIEVVDLQLYFRHRGAAALGLRSSLGPQLEHAANRKAPAGGPRGSLRVASRETRSPSFSDLADRLGSDVVDWLRVDRRLREAGAYPRRPGLTARRVLEALLGPDESPEPVLPLYEGLGRVMLLTSAAKGAGAEALRRADAEGRKGDRKKALWLAEVRAEADELVAWAEAAYAKTRPPPKRDEGGDEGRVQARKERDRERGGHYAGRTDEARRVVFAKAGVKRVMGCG